MIKKFLLVTSTSLILMLGFAQLAMAEWVDQCDMPACTEIGLCARDSTPSGTCWVYSNLQNVYATTCGPCYGP